MVSLRHSATPGWESREMKLEKLSSSVVRPDPRVLLTPNDQEVPSMYGIVVVMFTKSAAVPVPKVRDSLAKVLKEYRELAGRLVVDESGRGAIELNDKGVSFVEAIADVELAHVLESRDFTGMIPVDESQPAPEELLLVQYTSFKCGGIALGVSANHTVVDACAFWTFVDSWAKLARGVQLQCAPLHDRSAFAAREPLQFPQQSIGPTVPIPLGQYSPPDRVPVGRIHFGRDEVDRLKASFQGAYYTTFECLAAHLWRCAVKALALEPNKTTSVSILVNGRKLLSLPSAYFGNALCVVFPTCSVEQILQQPTSFAAEVIRDSVKGMDAEHERSMVDRWEFLRRKGEQLQDLGMKPVDVSINSWVGFPMYSLDFGGGNPVLASLAHTLRKGDIFIQPCPPLNSGGGVEVLVALQQEHLTAMLENIKDF